jgi:hypothetical protein
MEGIKKIGDYAFSNTAITSLEIPYGDVSIGEKAFENCGSLESINIPITVNSIGDGAFNGCGSLSDITVPCVVAEQDNKIFEGTGISDFNTGYDTFMNSANTPGKFEKNHAWNWVEGENESTIYAYECLKGDIVGLTAKDRRYVILAKPRYVLYTGSAIVLEDADVLTNCNRKTELPPLSSVTYTALDDGGKLSSDNKPVELGTYRASLEIVVQDSNDPHATVTPTQVYSIVEHLPSPPSDAPDDSDDPGAGNNPGGSETESDLKPAPSEPAPVKRVAALEPASVSSGDAIMPKTFQKGEPDSAPAHSEPSIDQGGTVSDSDLMEVEAGFSRHRFSRRHFLILLILIILGWLWWFLLLILDRDDDDDEEEEEAANAAQENADGTKKTDQNPNT